MRERDADITVAILLATFNGEAWLESLLTSLVSQSYPNICVYVRDDGSTDRSLDIVKRFLGERVVLVIDELGHLNSAASFLRLLAVAHADIYMFCDQDDIWLPAKVFNTVQAICEHGVAAPVLYHSDLVVVDQDQHVIAESFHRHEGVLLPAAHQFKHLVVQNCAVGCTMAVTEALVRLSALRDARPASIAMHDWWLALCAACVGKIIYSPQADILYRQHQHNVSGASRRTMLEKARFQLSTRGIEKINAYTDKIAAQALAFADFYGNVLSPSTVEDLRSVGRLADGSGLVGIWSCMRRGIRLQNAYMNAAIFFSAFASLLLGMRRMRKEEAHMGRIT